LLDDCSTDNSKTFLLEYAKNQKVSHCVFNEINSGNTFIQWKKGIVLAKGEYIWIAETDDFCELNFLEELIIPLIEDKDIVLSYCQSNRVDENGTVTGTWLDHTVDLDSELFTTDFCMDGNEFIERFLIYKNVIPNASAVLIRKEGLKKLGVISVEDRLKYCGDWLLYFKIVLNNKIAFVSQSLNDFRYHSQSVIATASRSENRISIINIDFFMRSKMVLYLNNRNVKNANFIKKRNDVIIKELKYEKGFIYLRNNEKWKGILTLISIFSFFLRKFQFNKKIKLKFKKLVS
jgi:hypothetical protein